MPEGNAEHKESFLWRRHREYADNTARSALIERYYFLVKKIAASLFLKRTDDEIEFDDYFQFGVVGLLESVDRFEQGRGASFETYASYRIKGSILDGLERMTEKRDQSTFRARMRKERLESLASNHSDKKSTLFEEMVEIALGLAIGYMLEDTNLVQNANSASVNEAFNEKELSLLKRHLVDVVKHLPDRERVIIEYHYFEQKSFDKISHKLGVTKGRISQLHKRSLRLMREHLANTNSLDDYL